MAGLTELRKKIRSKRLSSRKVERVVPQLADAEVAEFLAYLADHVSAETLGDVLADPKAQLILSQSIPRRTQTRVFEELDTWADTPSKNVWRWNVGAYLAKEVPPEKPPRRPAEVSAWIKRFNLESALSDDATRAAPLADKHIRWHLERLEDASIGDLVAGNAIQHRAIAGPAATAAILYLRWAERRMRLTARRARTWESRPDTDGLRLLSHRLKEALRAVGEEHVRPVRPTSELVLDPQGGAQVAFQHGSYGDIKAAVSFAGYERGALILDQAHPAELRVVLEWTLDAIHERSSPLRPALGELLGRPSWMRLVEDLNAALDEAAAAIQAADERIVFRLDPRTGSEGLTDVDVSAAVQKRGKGGKWSKGAVRAAGKLIEHPAARREDLGPLDLLTLADNNARERDVLVAEAVASLAGHPRVFLEESGERVTIERSAPTVGLMPSEGGYRVHVRVGDFEVPTYKGEARLIAYEEPARVFVAAVTDVLKAALLTFEAHPKEVPAAAVDRLLSLLPRLQPDAALVIPTDLRGEEVAADGTLVVRLRPEEDGMAFELFAQPLTGGPAWPPGEGPALAFSNRDGARVHARRDLSRERTHMRSMLDVLGLAPISSQRIAGLDAALDVLTALQQRDDVRIEWPEDRGAWTVGQASDLRVRVRRAGEWFGVDGGAEVDGQQVPLAALLQAVRRDEKYVRVSKTRFARIEDSLRNRLEDASDALVIDGQEVQAGLASLRAVDELGVVEADDAWREILGRVEAAESLDPAVPDGLQADLRDYQQEGFSWLCRLASWGAGACLADEMGLGKTVQALAVLLARKNEGPSLVVAPTSVCPGWQREASVFAPELDVRMYRGARRERLLANLGPGTLLITSYDVLARDGDGLAAIPMGTVVFDEAQAIKNARTRRAKAARNLDASWRLALTGTPLENHLGEVWSLFRTVSPGLLGPWEHFRRHYALPIERDGDAAAQRKLVQRLQPFLLRRTKAQVASELPPRTEVLHPVELSERERRLYDASRDEAIQGLGAAAEPEGEEKAKGKKKGSERFAVLAALTRLRRLACHPRMVVPSWSGSSAKLDAFLELASELAREGRRALVFSQFTSHLSIVREALDFRGHTSLYLDGKTPAKKRGALVEAWQEGSDPFFLISLKAGGTGLNLTAADTVIHLDPWWNPAAEDQASDRAHRIGQDKPVTVVRFVAQGTIEEKVLELHQEKRDLADALLAGGDTAAKLELADLKALLV
ncbi:MAG: DEAD/DEAH box helicase [Myxococcota bacterium]